MAQDKDLRPHGVPQPKGTAWLKEVKVDATRNAIQHLKQQAEERQFEEAKARGVTPQELIKKGKTDLDNLDPDFRGDGFVAVDDFSEFEAAPKSELTETGEDKASTSKKATTEASTEEKGDK